MLHNYCCWKALQSGYHCIVNSDKNEQNGNKYCVRPTLFQPKPFNLIHFVASLERQIPTQKNSIIQTNSRFVPLKVPINQRNSRRRCKHSFCAQKVPLISTTFRTGSRFSPNRALSCVTHNQIARICVTDATLYVLICKDTNDQTLSKVSKVFA